MSPDRDAVGRSGGRPGPGVARRRSSGWREPTGVPRSSEHHELSSWFTETVRAEIDPRIRSVETWEAASAEDPLFVLQVPWLPTGMTLGQVIERIRGQRGERRIQNAQDVARVVSTADALPTEVSCAEAMLSVPQILFTNLATASAMLNAFFLEACGARRYGEICFDIAEGMMTPG